MTAFKSLLLWVALAAASVFAQPVTLDATVTFPGLPAGPQGPAGATGPQGPQGIQGATGPQGPAGSGSGSAYSQRPAIYSPDANAPAFKKGTGNTLYFKAGAQLEIGGVLCAPTSDQAVTGPALVAGTDYRFIAKADCSLQYITYSDAIPMGGAVVGGFHHLIGSPATNLGTGGGWTPTLLEWSIWDLSFRPKLQCDPRGMTRIGNAGFWTDIYFQGDSSNADGVSRNNDTILTGGNPPLRPADYGGNGIAKYTTMNWWEANEHLRQHGKRLPTYEELVLAAFGTNEGYGRGNHPVKTGFAMANTGTSSSDPNFTSKWGVIQSTGVIWIWTATPSMWQGTQTANAHGWEAYDLTGGRGKLILQNDRGATYKLFGASSVYKHDGSPTGATWVAGSRSMETLETLWDSSVNIAMRGVCDHYQR